MLDSVISYIFFISYSNNSGTILVPVPDRPHYGDFGSCTESTDGAFIYNNPLAMNSSGSFLYVASDQVGESSVCPVNFDGSLDACTTSAEPTFDAPGTLTLNPAGTLLYVGNINNNTVSICPLNNSNGSLGNCSATNAGNTLRQP